jgi:hypothetical protein
LAVALEVGTHYGVEFGEALDNSLIGCPVLGPGGQYFARQPVVLSQIVRPEIELEPNAQPCGVFFGRLRPHVLPWRPELDLNPEAVTHNDQVERAISARLWSADVVVEADDGTAPVEPEALG